MFIVPIKYPNSNKNIYMKKTKFKFFGFYGFFQADVMELLVFRKNPIHNVSFRQDG